MKRVEGVTDSCQRCGEMMVRELVGVRGEEVGEPRGASGWLD